MRLPLDHLFHSRHFCLNEIHRQTAFGSDHFPILTDLQLDRTNRDENGDGISADAGERAWAKREDRPNGRRCWLPCDGFNTHVLPRNPAYLTE